MWNFIEWKPFLDKTKYETKKYFSLHTYTWHTRVQTKWNENDGEKLLDFFYLLFVDYFFNFRLLASWVVHFTMFNFHLIGRSVDILPVLWFSFHVFHTMIVTHSYHSAHTNRVCETNECRLHSLGAVQARQMLLIYFQFTVCHAHRRTGMNEAQNTRKKCVCRNLNRARQIWNTVSVLFTSAMGYFRIVSFSICIVGHVFWTIFSGTFSISCFLFMWVILCCFLCLCGFLWWRFWKRIQTVQ